MTPGCLIREIPRRPRWSTFYVGLGINTAAVLLLVVADPHLRTKALLQPLTPSNYITLVAPVLQPPRTSTPPAVAVLPTIAKPERSQLPLPPSRAEKSKPQVEIAKAQPAPASSAALTVPKPAAAEPAKEIKTNVFDPEKSDFAMVRESARKVQTGGFGDPNGLPGQGDPKRETIAAVNLGSFDLPAGPGKGNGSGGSRGTTGRIAATGFGEVSAQTVAARNEDVAASGFGDVVAKARTVDSQQVVAPPRVQPVQILFKPRPTYTEEARRLGVQGEVLLDVVFEASGALQINRVVKGLGYGLDDKALEAAKKIQFRPALRDGQPYDYAALVHIRFELAD